MVDDCACITVEAAPVPEAASRRELAVERAASADDRQAHAAAILELRREHAAAIVERDQRIVALAGEVAELGAQLARARRELAHARGGPVGAALLVAAALAVGWWLVRWAAGAR
jgi:hypothetical protein